MAMALLASSLFAADAPKKAPAPDPSATARRGTDLAEAGQCAQALPLLTKSVSHLADKELKKTSRAFTGCAAPWP